LSQEPDHESQNQAIEALGSQIGQFAQRTQARDELKMRSEELARLNSDLAPANRTKDEFLAGISHEIRPPLNGLIGAAEALQPTALNREQRDAPEIVNSSAHHLHAVLNDVLDFSGIEAGHVELFSEATSLSKFIHHGSVTFLTSLQEAGKRGCPTIEITDTGIGNPPWCDSGFPAMPLSAPWWNFGLKPATRVAC